MIAEAKSVIPGGVQHNLAFNSPFPIVITKAQGNKLYDIDGNDYYDLLQAGGPTIIGSNDPIARDAVKELLDTCGSSTGLFHEYEYKLDKKISKCVPSVDKFRMLGSGTEACMCALRVARLKTGKMNVLKMGGAYHGWSDQIISRPTQHTKNTIKNSRNSTIVIREYSRNCRKKIHLA